MADIRTRITYYILRLENAKLENVIFSILRLYHFFDLSQLFLLYIFYRGGVLKCLFLRVLSVLSPISKSWCFICFLKILQNQKYTHRFSPIKGLRCGEKDCAFLYTSPKICSLVSIEYENIIDLLKYEYQRKRVKILLRIPGSIDRHFPILPPRLTFLRQASSHLVNLLRGRRRGRGVEKVGGRVGWLVEAQLKFSRRNNAETRKRRKKFLPAHFDPRTEEEAVIALKWTWVTQGPPPPRRGIINSQQRAR